MTTDLTILALDMSSTAIGAVVLTNGVMTEHTTFWLRADHDIGKRCATALWFLRPWLDKHLDIDLVAIESPVARFARAVIPQARVSGAVLGLLAERGLLWVEISPAQAKRALTRKGTASKAEMMLAAGLDDEHQADALGLARAAMKMQIVKEAA